MSSIERTMFAFVDQGEVRLITGDIDLAQMNKSGEVEIEFEISDDGSAKDAGYSDWAFINDAGSSGSDGVNEYGVSITRDPSNTTGESVQDQFSVSISDKGKLKITDQNAETATDNGRGRFVFTVTVNYKDKNGVEHSVPTDPRLWNRY